MASPHIVMTLMSGTLALALGTGIALDQRGSPPPTSQGRGSAPKTAPAPKPATQTSQKPTTPPAGSLTPAQHLTQQPKLAAKLQPLLPPGTDMQLAAAGFKNLGQFVAAVHVSDNLKIPFDTLKTRLTGTDPKSLGQAIHELRPAADADLEVRKAEAQAKKDQGSK